jgi:hypothetical protein
MRSWTGVWQPALCPRLPCHPSYGLHPEIIGLTVQLSERLLFRRYRAVDDVSES